MVSLLESDDYILTVIITLFLTINFNLEIGVIYSFMAIIDWISYYIVFDKSAFSLVPIERDRKNRFTSLVWAMGIYVGFIFIVNFITLKMNVAQGATAIDNVSALISGAFSSTPILYGSKYLRLVVWGILIPIIETRLFFRTLLQWGIHSSGAKFPQDIFNIRALTIAAFFGAMFSVFHIVAKGITNNASLLATFIFGFVSVLMVIHFKEAIQAIFLHIITNTIATMQQLGIGFFEVGTTGINTAGFMVLGGVILAAWALLFQQIPLDLFKARA